jgi:hypothetical protein
MFNHNHPFIYFFRHRELSLHREPIADLLDRNTLERIALTAFFDYYRDHPDEPPSKYRHFPQTYVYLNMEKH